MNRIPQLVLMLLGATNRLVRRYGGLYVNRYKLMSLIRSGPIATNITVPLICWRKDYPYVRGI